MIGDGPLGGFRVPPCGVAQIRLSADNVRRVLNIRDAPQHINFPALLDRLSVDYAITYDVLDEAEMPHEGVEACFNSENLVIYIRTDVFEKLCQNDTRARFTIMHEFGHFLLGHRRTINRSTQKLSPLKVYEDSEWQANQFAAEVLMPLEVIRVQGLTTAADIEKYFHVSCQAAALRAKQLIKRGEI